MFKLLYVDLSNKKQICTKSINCYEICFLWMRLGIYNVPIYNPAVIRLKEIKKNAREKEKKFTFSMIRNRSFWICLLPHLITFSSWLLHFITSKGWRGATQSYTFSDANDSVCPGRLRKRSFYIHGILLRFELMLHRK